MPEVHSRLSPSSAVRWLTCTPCLRMEDGMPDTAGRDAQEGTLAHLLGEKTLLYRLGEISGQKYAAQLRKIKKNELYNEDMMEHVNGYVDFVLEHYEDAKVICAEATCEVEARLDFSGWAKGGFGTGDAVVVTDSYIEVIDLKYGQGVRVDVMDNPQLKLYGLGAYAAYAELFDFDKVIISIYQPRLHNIGSFEIAVDELLDWANNTVRPRAKLALAGEGEFVPGKHCHFCKAGALCKARAEANLELAKMEFTDPEYLDEGELAMVLKKAEDLEKWVKAIREYVFKEAMKRPIPGFKIVASKSSRVIGNPDAVERVLAEEGFDREALYTRKIKGITLLEKMVGKKEFNELCGDYIMKPKGKPTLAYAEDPREVYSSADMDFENLD